MRLLTIFLLALFVGAPLCSVQAQVAGVGHMNCPSSMVQSSQQPRLALVIAISDYDRDGRINSDSGATASAGYMPDLPNPANDGLRMREALCRLGFEVTLARDPTKATLEEELALFGDRLALSPNAVALIFYSGHGIQVNGENWLIPSGARLPVDRDLTRLSEQSQAGIIAAHAVRLGTAFQYLRNPEAGGHGLNLVFIDACRNNPWDERIFGRNRSPATRGLADQPPPSRIGTLVAYSTSSGDVAADGVAGGNSPFTAALLELIEQPGLSIQDLLILVRNSVYSATGQASWENGSLLERFCFAGCETSLTGNFAQGASARNNQGLVARLARNATPSSTEREARNDTSSWLSAIISWISNSFESVLESEPTITLDTSVPPRGEAREEVSSWNSTVPSWISGIAAFESAARSAGFIQTVIGLNHMTGSLPHSDPIRGVRWLRLAAAAGNPMAETGLGFAHDQGRGAERNHAEAVSWYRRAAEQGHSLAERNLGLMYLTGSGIGRDQAQAIIWLRRAADHGDPGARNSLGTLYQLGAGVEQNLAQAVQWYRLAADGLSVPALRNLGFLHENGLGVARSDVQAFAWYRRAAERGDADAQNDLGRLYLTGTGIAPQPEQAAIWFRRAADRGSAEAQFNLGLLLAEGAPTVPQVRAEAVVLMSRAAANGLESARTWLSSRGITPISD